jgi:hypothetical protein
MFEIIHTGIQTIRLVALYQLRVLLIDAMNFFERRAQPASQKKIIAGLSTPQFRNSPIL